MSPEHWSKPVDDDDRGYLYGDGLFETVRVVLREGRGHVRWLDAHVARLRRSGLALGFSPTSLDDAEALLRTLPERSPGLWRLTLTRDDPAAPFGGSGSIRLRYRPWLERPRPRLGLVRGSYLPQDELARHKTTSYMRYILARRAALERGFDEALLGSSCGLVGECAAASALFWRDDRWLISPLDGLLDGVTRAGLLELMTQHAIPHELRPIPLHELDTIQEIALCSAAVGVQAAASLEGRPLAHHHTDALASLLETR